MAVGLSAVWSGRWVRLPGGLSRFLPCQVGTHLSRLRSLGWNQCSHGLTSRPLESCHHSCLSAVCGILGYPKGSAAELLDGALKLRCCFTPFSNRFPTWALPPVGCGRIMDFTIVTSSAAGQHEGGHDIHGRLQHGTWPGGHAGADRARGQDRRRLARAALAGAHSSRHFGERLGHDDHDIAARGRPGQRAQSRAGRDSRGSFSGTWPASTPARPPWQPCGPPSLTWCSHSSPPQSTSYLQPCDVAVLPQLQELHPDASERHSCPRRSRWLLRWPGHEQSMAAPVFGRMGSPRSEGPLGRQPGVVDWLASLARPQRRRFPRCSRRGRGAPRPR